VQPGKGGKRYMGWIYHSPGFDQHFPCSGFLPGLADVLPIAGLTRFCGPAQDKDGQPVIIGGNDAAFAAENRLGTGRD
ncbi:hypothetical protein SB772_45535, partial [Paraburkholderia sp. SIMBA_030]